MEGQGVQIQEELLLAKQSRQEGNEGRARVCARRAAGAAVQQYLQRSGTTTEVGSVLQALMDLRAQNDLPPRVQNALDWLVQRVNQDHALPPEVDLIQEAAVVIRYLDQLA